MNPNTPTNNNEMILGGLPFKLKHQETDTFQAKSQQALNLMDEAYVPPKSQSTFMFDFNTNSKRN